jgi:hypothetical protein
MVCITRVISFEIVKPKNDLTCSYHASGPRHQETIRCFILDTKLPEELDRINQRFIRSSSSHNDNRGLRVIMF